MADTQAFSRDLATLQTRSEDEAHVYKDMSPEGKRKCMDDLENTLQTLQKIKKNLKEADEHSPDKNLVQVVLDKKNKRVFVKEDFEKSFEAHNSRHRERAVCRTVRKSNPDDTPIYPPSIKSVVIQDNFKFDDNKYLQPAVMCFIQFSSNEDVDTVLRLKKMDMSIYTDSGCEGAGRVEFIRPTESQATHKTLRIIGKAIARLEEIDEELKKIGAVRVHGGMPELGPEFIDKAWYITKLQECKRLRAVGVSLDHHSHAPLAGRKPVDVEALKRLIKPLYDEECDILIQLREYQLSGLDFNFKHPAV